MEQIGLIYSFAHLFEGKRIALVRNIEELQSICTKYEIKVLRMDLIRFLVDTQGEEFAIYFKDTQITNFRLFYEVCSKVGKKDTPFFIPIVTNFLDMWLSNLTSLDGLARTGEATVGES